MTDMIYGESLGLAAMTIRLVLATALGFTVGINREKKRRGAGTRTHALVSMASCLVMITSEYIAVRFPGYNGDVARLGAQVISGMGFIGAGTIMVTRYNHIRGLTTAASLWATACLGLAVGSGLISASLIAAAIMLFLLITVEKMDKYMKTNTIVMDYLIVFESMMAFSRFLEEIKQAHIKINNIEINRDSAEGSAVIVIATLEKQKNLESFMEELRYRDGIELMNEL